MQRCLRVYIQHYNQHGPTGRSASMYRTHPPSRSSSARIGKAQCTDVIYSVVWFTSTGELHERIYVPQATG
jgi:hypothetical protein